MSSIPFLNMENAFTGLYAAHESLLEAREQLSYAEDPMESDAGHDAVSAAIQRQTQAELLLILAVRRVDFTVGDLPLAYYVQGQRIGIDLRRDA